jgi:serine/threonine protein phosphatase 1
MPRTFVIGDVHGCSATLEKLLTSLNIQRGDQLYFLGDYIDRGPGSKEAVDTIIELREKGYAVFILRGNHEQLFIDSDKGHREWTLWEQNGGDTAMQSFGIHSFKDLDPKYKEFFLNTTHYYALEKHVLVHAGLNFTISDPFSDQKAMLWIRDYKVVKEKINGRTIVHGHTPLALEAIVNTDPEKGKLGIDGGCVYKGIKGLGYLIAFELSEGKIHYEECIDIL